MALSNEPGPVRWSEILTRAHAPGLALVCLGIWLHAADGLVVATMMPATVAEIGGGEWVAWSVALYEVGSIVAGATGGFLSIRLGLRRPMSVAAALFAFGCVISATAPSMPVLLGGRLFQGLGGGGLMALSFVAVTLLFPRRLIARALAAVSTLWGVSSFLGPLVGGLFVEFATWRLGFWFFALQALALALWIGVAAPLRPPAWSDRAARSVPLLRLAVLSADIVSVAYGGIEIAPLRTPLFVAAGVSCLVVFLLLDGRAHGNRLLPAAPFSLRSAHGSALAMILCFAAGTVALTAYGPLLITLAHGTSVLVAGYIVAASSVGWTVFAVLASGADPRHDPKFIAAGMLLVSASILGLVYSLPQGPVWLIAVFAALEGGGFGVSWTFILRRVTSLAPAGETERISGAIPTVQRLGYAVGAAYVGIVANAAGFVTAESADEVAAAAHWIFLGSVPLAALGLVAMARFVSARRPDSVPAPREP